MIWEPSPPTCVPEKLQAYFDSVGSIDVFSPNHLELLSLFGRSEEALDKGIIQALALGFVQVGIGYAKQGAVVLRVGEHRCLVMSTGKPPVWLPLFYERGEALEASKSKVFDATGAGNASWAVLLWDTARLMIL